MAKLAILTPDPESPLFGSRWPRILEQLKAPLEELGHEVEARPWTQARDLDGFSLVMPLTVWGYHLAGEQWLAEVAAWERQAASLRNSPAVLRWNADKRYIGKLAAAGAPIPPTTFCDRVTEAILGEAAATFGVDRLVAKPQVSAGAFQTIRWSPGEPLEGAPEGAAMIQPYLPSIEGLGEMSLIFFGGAFSHAIRKVPQPGDFRVQPEYDGIITACDPAPDELEAAQAALDAAGEELLYARVDLVRDLSDRPVLMELELVEPDLYLGFSAEAPAAFARSVTRLI